MKLKILLVFLFIVLSCKDTTTEKQSTPIQTPETETPKKEKNKKITILGTFHFANTTDYSAIVLEDLDSDKRQMELEKLVDNLAKFKPTKILVERESALNDTLNKRFVDYKNGQYDLPHNEIYQIGFRLAQKMGLDKVHGIDHQMDLGDEALVTYLNEQGLMEDFGKIIASSQVWAQDQTKFLKTHTIGEVLEKLNTPDSEKFNRNLYLDGILNIVDSGNSPASDYVANWYKRNLYIKKNIDDLIDENDRILVIIGAGHSAILKDFYRSSENVEYVDLANISE